MLDEQVREARRRGLGRVCWLWEGPSGRVLYKYSIVLKGGGRDPHAQWPDSLRPRNWFSGPQTFFFTRILSSFPIKCAARFFSLLWSAFQFPAS